MNDILFFGIPLLEWIGYIASAFVLFSLSLSSILKLRVYNLIGAAIFSFYGFAIGALPVGIMNMIIVFTNLYYLRKLYSKKETFEIIQTDLNQEYIEKFIIHNQKDISKYFPLFDASLPKNHIVFMVMRDMNLAGIFIAHPKNSDLLIDLDYVTPAYRDYKNGMFIFTQLNSTFKKQGFKRLISETNVPQQISYLKRMGFVEEGISLFTKGI